MYNLEDLEKETVFYDGETEELLFQKINGVWVDSKGNKVDKQKVLDRWNGVDGSIEQINSKTEMVNHPSHYGGESDPYEAIKVIEAWGLCFHLGNVAKYICRTGKKDNELQELKKARWYLDRKIKNLENGK